MGQDEDEDGRVPHRPREVPLGDNVRGQLHPGEVLHVLVLVVDDLREAHLPAAVGHLLGEDPLPDLALEALL